jgi:type IV pilus assembly protein PilY1
MIPRKLIALLGCCGLLLASLPAPAEDIDIFIGSSGGTATAPKVMIMVDNSLDWVQDQPNGKSKFMALSAVLDSITTPMNVGLAMFASGSPAGAYVRFAPRDMSVAANRTAFKNLLNVISADANVNKETPFAKDESAALYELYKYFSGLKPRSGSLAQNKWADAVGNVDGSYPGSTGAAQGLTTGFAFKADGTYDSVATACGRNYVIYIVANNAGGGAVGARVYETVDSGAQILPAPGSPDTYADEWARYLYASQNPQVVTYVLDAYFPDSNQDLGYSLSLQGIAGMGGGSYKHVRNQTEITNELLRIFAEIKAVNGTFASASLPVNATNRAQNQNQVFIGMFRPDPDAKPRWFGNLKQYQLILNSAGGIELADVNGAAAINPLTGFVGVCATSFWTTDSGPYWTNVTTNPSPAGSCPATTLDKYSDSPDGPQVEKGSVAEVVRKGNNPPTTNTTPTYAVNRTVYTLSNPAAPASPALTAFNAASSGLAQPVVDFTLGYDVNDENRNASVTDTRPSLHGDVVHSRPLPLNYGGTTGVVVYYGANDGTLRAVQANTGKELWAFVAREHFSQLQRLKDQSPLVNYPNLPAGVAPTPTAKDYFFDGSIGAFQDSSNSRIWIYPTMRRGGRAMYAFDVTNPTSPVFKWKVGCPNLADDVGCSAGMTGIGRTWSTPLAAFVKGYSATVPVLIAGGGYDSCEDQNAAAPACTSPKGAAVYILNGNDGTVLATFSATRSVVAEVALLDIDNDGMVDYAFAVDTGGNIYRIDFIDGPTTKVALDSTKWVMRRVAYTNGAGRKFLFPPALLLNSGKVYVGLGSGDREHPLITNYPYTTPVVNRFYMYVDNLATPPVATNLDDATLMLNNTANTTCASEVVTPISSKKGWFMDLTQNGTGEQTVTSAVIAGGLVTFSTNRPIPTSAASCSTALGEARGYFLNILNGSGAIGTTGSCGGTRSGVFVGGGLPPSPVLGTIPVGGVPRTVVIGAIQKSGAGSSPISPQLVVPPITSRRSRVYWYTPGADN